MLGQRLACSALLEIVPHCQLSAGISMPPLQHSLVSRQAGKLALMQSSWLWVPGVAPTEGV